MISIARKAAAQPRVEEEAAHSVTASAGAAIQGIRKRSSRTVSAPPVAAPVHMQKITTARV
jgi:hypothetical protein